MDAPDLLVLRDYPWRHGGPDLALCFPDGSPLPKQRTISFEPFKGADGSPLPDMGLLTVTFVVGTPKLRFQDS